MKSLNIAYTNTKGQFVIPKEIRDELNITDKSPLQIRVIGKTIMIDPVSYVRTKSDIDSDDFLEVLKSVKGSWTDDKSIEDYDEIKKSALKTAKRIKNSRW